MCPIGGLDPDLLGQQKERSAAFGISAYSLKSASQNGMRMCYVFVVSLVKTSVGKKGT